MDKMNHLMAEKNKNNKDSQKGQVTLKKINKSLAIFLFLGKTVKVESTVHAFVVNN